MGMSTHVVGFRPPDEKWRQMKAVWDACVAASTDIPMDVLDFFGHEDPDERGVEISLNFTGWNDGRSSEGFEVQVADIPEGCATIRFYNSW